MVKLVAVFKRVKVAPGPSRFGIHHFRGPNNPKPIKIQNRSKLLGTVPIDLKKWTQSQSFHTEKWVVYKRKNLGFQKPYQNQGNHIYGSFGIFWTISQQPTSERGKSLPNNLPSYELIHWSRLYGKNTPHCAQLEVQVSIGMILARSSIVWNGFSNFDLLGLISDTPAQKLNLSIDTWHLDPLNINKQKQKTQNNNSMSPAENPIVVQWGKWKRTWMIPTELLQRFAWKHPWRELRG